MSKKAFVLMPFSSDFDDVYELGIKAVAKEFNVNAERLDDQIFDSDMLQEIYGQIDKSDFIIADMTGRNPNVFYEVGYADARKKLIVLVTQNSNDIPFDLSHRPHVVYEGSIVKLKDELRTRIRWAVKELEKRVNNPLALSLREHYSTLERTDDTDTVTVNFVLDITNLTDTKITGIEMIYIYTGAGWTLFKDKIELKLSKSDSPPYTHRHLLKPDISIIPQNDKISIDFHGKKIVYASWRGGERTETYNLQGRILVVLHGHTITQKHEVSMDVSATWSEGYDAAF